jgi:hypothetical protein
MVPLIAFSLRAHDIFLSGLFFAWLAFGATGCVSDDPAGLRGKPAPAPAAGEAKGLQTATFALG